MCKRCDWAQSSEREKQYHDTEWGYEKHDDRELFECLVLESMQSGLSWSTILNKRDTLREAFDDFDIETVARYSEEKVEELLNNPGVIRHKQKILATINNARVIQKIQISHGSFNQYIWSFVDYQPIVNEWQSIKEVPSRNELSDNLAKELKKQGFKFLGSTTLYSFMQSVGMIDDHMSYCFRKNP